MLIDHFPLVGLRLTTPRLELRLPSPEELARTIPVAVEGLLPCLPLLGLGAAVRGTGPGHHHDNDANSM
jgi:hypothetical protein